MTYTENEIIEKAKEIFDSHDKDKRALLDEQESRNFMIAWLNFVNPRIPFQEWFF